MAAPSSSWALARCVAGIAKRSGMHATPSLAADRAAQGTPFHDNGLSAYSALDQRKQAPAAPGESTP